MSELDNYNYISLGVIIQRAMPDCLAMVLTRLMYLKSFTPFSEIKTIPAFLFKTFAYSSYDVMRNHRYFGSKIELILEIREHFIIEDESGILFFRLFTTLNQYKDFYKITEETLNKKREKE